MSEPATLAPDALLLVEADGVKTKGRLLAVTDTLLRIRTNTYPSDYEVPWTAIRRISRRAGHERRRWIAMTLAVVFGVPLGTIGWFLDALNASTSGSSRGGALLLYLGLAGVVVGWLVGTLIAFAFPGPWWEPIYAVPEGATVAAEEAVETRLTAHAIPEAERRTAVENSHMSTLVAWTVLALLIVGVLGFCNYARG